MTKVLLRTILCCSIGAFASDASAESVQSSILDVINRCISSTRTGLFKELGERGTFVKGTADSITLRVGYDDGDFEVLGSTSTPKEGTQLSSCHMAGLPLKDEDFRALLAGMKHQLGRTGFEQVDGNSETNLTFADCSTKNMTTSVFALYSKKREKATLVVSTVTPPDGSFCKKGLS